MNGKQVIGGFVLLILIYLLVKNGEATSKVIEALAKGVSSTTESLQGR